MTTSVETCSHTHNVILTANVNTVVKVANNIYDAKLCQSCQHHITGWAGLSYSDAKTERDIVLQKQNV
jgi:hypothetical protein